MNCFSSALTFSVGTFGWEPCWNDMIVRKIRLQNIINCTKFSQHSSKTEMMLFQQLERESVVCMANSCGCITVTTSTQSWLKTCSSVVLVALLSKVVVDPFFFKSVLIFLPKISACCVKSFLALLCILISFSILHVWPAGGAVASVWFSPGSADPCLAAAAQCSSAGGSRRKAQSTGNPEEGQSIRTIKIWS